MRSKGFSAGMIVLLTVFAVIVLVTGAPVAAGERDRNSDSPSLPTAYFHPKVLYFRAGTMSTKTTTLTNPSAETLSIKSFALSGTNNVVMTNNCAPSLAAGASCTVSLTCLPSGSGRIGELTESDNSAVGHHNVQLEAK
jgi:hypothetical protein